MGGPRVLGPAGASWAFERALLETERGDTHLARNTAPEAPPQLAQVCLRPLLQVQPFPLAPAAAGCQTPRSCRGSAGWPLGAGSTVAVPGTAPSGPAWKGGKGIPALLRPGPIAPGGVRSTRGADPLAHSCLVSHRLAGLTSLPAVAPALPGP